MRLTRFTIALAACGAAVWVLGASGTAVAQGTIQRVESPGRTSVFATGGYNAQTDDESRLGKGIGFTGGIGYRLTRRLSVEGVVARFAHERDLLFHAITFDANGQPIATPYPSRLTGAATYALGQARFVFSTARVRPYVTGALGIMRYSGNGWAAVFPPEPGQPRPNPPAVSATAMAMGANGGVDVVVARRLAVGPYVGLLLSGTGETGTKYLVHGGVRITAGL